MWHLMRREDSDRLQRPFRAALVLLVVGWALAAPLLAQDTAAEPVLARCMISIEDEAEVAAQEPGLLVSFDHREGDRVAAGELLAQIDDTERRIQLEIASAEHKSAAEQADNDINVRYAEAAAKVAEAEFIQANEANKRVAETFPVTEIRRLQLAWHKAFFQIKQANLEQRVARFTADTKGGEAKLADANISRRRVVSPIDGEIVACYKRLGEWVNPGDRVLRVVRLDTLRVEGFVEAELYDPRDVAGRAVSLEVAMANNRIVKAKGRVVYVSPLVESGNTFRIWAEVANEQEDDQWLLRPGQTAQMTIHTRQPAQKPAQKPAQRKAAQQKSINQKPLQQNSSQRRIDEPPTEQRPTLAEPKEATDAKHPDKSAANPAAKTADQPAAKP